MTEPDFNLEGDLAHEEATGTIVFPAGCVTDAQRIVHLEYRMQYFADLAAAGESHGQPLDRDTLNAITRTKEALAAARSAHRSQN